MVILKPSYLSFLEKNLFKSGGGGGKVTLSQKEYWKKEIKIQKLTTRLFCI